jgi:glycosyltransferase involved in cell wall biosynthesis
MPVPIASPTVEVVVPVYNEAAVLELQLERLTRYLDEAFPLAWRVTVADNASTDGTGALVDALAARMDGVHGLHVPRRGRGAALREAWMASEADVVAYMDVDLSTNLASLLPLVAPLISGHSHMAIGTRLVRSAQVRRQLKREVLSRGYNHLTRVALGARFSDAQCGFKGLRGDVARRLVPLVEDDGWFFDTELLALAERNRLRIYEVPVAWIEDLDSRVHIPSTVAGDLRGLWRLRRSFWRGEGVLDPTAIPAPVARHLALAGD